MKKGEISMTKASRMKRRDAYACKLYREGNPIVDVCQMCQMSVPTLYIILRKHGVKLRTSKGKKKRKGVPISHAWIEPKNTSPAADIAEMRARMLLEPSTRRIKTAVEDGAVLPIEEQLRRDGYVEVKTTPRGPMTKTHALSIRWDGNGEEYGRAWIERPAIRKPSWYLRAFSFLCDCFAFMRKDEKGTVNK